MTTLTNVLTADGLTHVSANDTPFETLCGEPVAHRRSGAAVDCLTCQWLARQVLAGRRIVLPPLVQRGRKERTKHGG